MRSDVICHTMSTPAIVSESREEYRESETGSKHSYYLLIRTPYIPRSSDIWYFIDDPSNLQPPTMYITCLRCTETSHSPTTGSVSVAHIARRCSSHRPSPGVPACFPVFLFSFFFAFSLWLFCFVFCFPQFFDLICFVLGRFRIWIVRCSLFAGWQLTPPALAWSLVLRIMQPLRPSSVPGFTVHSNIAQHGTPRHLLVTFYRYCHLNWAKQERPIHITPQFFPSGLHSSYIVHLAHSRTSFELY